MLIVSQNKKTVLNLNAMESVVAGNNNTIRAFVISSKSEDENYYEIALYESDTKANCVLNQLWSAYDNGKKVFIMP